MPQSEAGFRLSLTTKSCILYCIGLHLPLTLPVGFQGSTPKAADKQEEQPSGEQSCPSRKLPLLLQALPKLP